VFISIHLHHHYRRLSAFIGGPLFFFDLGIVGIGTTNPQ
jgi:hypothetical protein